MNELQRYQNHNEKRLIGSEYASHLPPELELEQALSWALDVAAHLAKPLYTVLADQTDLGLSVVPMLGGMNLICGTRPSIAEMLNFGDTSTIHAACEDCRESVLYLSDGSTMYVFSDGSAIQIEKNAN